MVIDVHVDVHEKATFLADVLSVNTKEILNGSCSSPRREKCLVRIPSQKANYQILIIMYGNRCEIIYSAEGFHSDNFLNSKAPFSVPFPSLYFTTDGVT